MYKRQIQYAAIAAYTRHAEMEEYIRECNRILVGLSGELSGILKNSNIAFPDMLGGFYCFPGFEAYRDALAKKGIHTSEELAMALLNETGVAGLPGDHFGCSPADLRMRLSYVNFSGDVALNSLSRDENVTREFVQANCSETLEAFGHIVSWVNSL